MGGHERDLRGSCCGRLVRGVCGEQDRELLSCLHVRRDAGGGRRPGREAK